MSSLKIVVNSASYTGDYVGYSPIITDGLSTWSFFKNSASDSTKNFSGGEDLSVFGAPTYDSGYAHTTGDANYFITPASDTPEITVIGVARVTDPSQMDDALALPSIGGNYDTRTSNLDRVGLDLGFRNLGNDPHIVFKRAGDGDVSTSAILNGDVEGFDVEEFNFFAGVGYEDGSVFVRHPQTDSEFSRVGPTPALSSETLAAGGERALSSGEVDIAYFAVYDRALSTDEIGQVYEQVKAYLAARHSISI